MASARVTHKQRFLNLLSDGQPHSHHEAYGLGIIAHSRADDLRHDDGYDIRSWREDGLYWYQLVVAPSAGTVEPSPAEGGASGLPPDVPFVPLPADEGGETAASPSQLSMLAPEEDRPHMYRRDAA